MIANVVWPSLYLADRLVAPFVIIASLAIECAALKSVLKITLQRAFALAATMNLASATLGAFLISTAGWYWTIGPGLAIEDYFNTGTFNPISWVFTIVLAIILNTILESLVATTFFQVRSARAIVWIAIANSLTALLAYASLHIFPIRYL